MSIEQKCDKCEGKGVVNFEKPVLIDYKDWDMNELIYAINYLLKITE